MANNAVTYTREQRKHADMTQTPLVTIDYDDRHVVYETARTGRFTCQGPPNSPSLATALRLLRELLQTHYPTSPALAELASPPAEPAPAPAAAPPPAAGLPSRFFRVEAPGKPWDGVEFDTPADATEEMIAQAAFDVAVEYLDYGWVELTAANGKPLPGAGRG